MGYREKALDVFEERCVVCGTAEDVEIHHMDRDRTNEDIDNLVPLCSTHHHVIHKAEHPYTAFFALSDPFLTLLDDTVEARGLSGRAEAVSRALLEFARAAESDPLTLQRARSLAESNWWAHAYRSGLRDPGDPQNTQSDKGRNS